MAKNAEVEVKLADTKMVMDLVQSANDVVSSAVEHQAGCRAKGIDFCVVCANVGDMVKPLREFFRRWCQNDPPAPSPEPTAACKAAMAANAQEARECAADGNKAGLALYCGACITCDQLTRRVRPAKGPEGGEVYECTECAGEKLPETDLDLLRPPAPAPREHEHVCQSCCFLYEVEEFQTEGHVCPKCQHRQVCSHPEFKAPKEICYYCGHEATETVYEHSNSAIFVCADHGHGPIQARDECEMCKSKKGPIIRIPTGGGQFITCIPCAKAMRVALKEVIEEVEEGKR